MSAILEVRNVSRSFGETLAVDNVSFDIEAGEVLTLLGRSGCGKSTTLRLVAGLDQPDHGSIRLRGKTIVSTADKVHLAAEKRNIGLVFQSYAVWPHMSVAENIAFPLKVRRMDRETIAEKVSKAAEMVGLTAMLERAGTQLSGGQQQRVALARALVHEPDLLLLDEPFSNLDTELREELRSQMKHLQETLGTSVLYVTHDQSDAMILSHRVAVMYNGHIQQIGTPQQIYEDPANFFIQRFIGRVLIFDGRIVERSAETTVVDFGDDVRVSIPTRESYPPIGSQVRLTIRQEDTQLAGEPSAARASIPAEVTDSWYLGHRRDCALVTATNRNTIPLSKHVDVKPRDRVLLSFDPEKVRLWCID